MSPSDLVKTNKQTNKRTNKQTKPKQTQNFHSRREEVNQSETMERGRAAKEPVWENLVVLVSADANAV